MTNLLYGIGSFAAKKPWTVLGLWLIAAIAVVGSANAWGADLEDTFSVPGVDSDKALNLLTAANSDQAGLTARVVIAQPDGATALSTSPEAVETIGELRNELAALPNVLGVSDPLQDGSISSDGRIGLIVLQYPVIEDLAPVDMERLEETVIEARADAPFQIEAGGDLFFAFEEPETGVGELIGLIAAVVILLIAFGSVIAMGLPIGMALFGLALGTTSLSLLARFTEIPSFAPQIGAMVGLGVGIDYALFLVTRHREFLSEGVPVAEAAARSVATAGKSVVFAGGTVVIAILGLAVAGVPFMTAAGIAISVIVAVMVIASITLLPAFLSLVGPWIDRLSVGRNRSAGSAVSPGWERWGRHVANHAWAYAIGVTTLLLVLTAPVLSLRLGAFDEGTMSVTTTQRRAYDLVAEGFGPGMNGPLLIAVDGVEIADELHTAIAADPGIAAVAPPSINTEANVATIVAFPSTAPQDQATVETVDRLRADVIAPITANTGSSAHVGGQTATFSDVADRVSDRLPIFVVAVIVLSFLLLMIVFRSILVPLKAAILNLLSIGASYGVLVAVFQWGWGLSLLGLDETVPIVSFIPMFMFAILFGLSMDYEVFLLSRVREEYLETGDNDGSVIHGIARTARVITSAALIMISVFGGFVFAADPVTKMFGLGLATAIFVDASIVRVVLVPATMKLMGDANWWWPFGARERS